MTFYLGNRATSLNLSDQAASRAIQILPTYAEAFLAKSEVYFGQQKPQAANDAAQKCIELGPNIAACRAQKGIVMHELGRAGEGPPFILQAITLDPRSPFLHRYYFLLGNAYLYAGQVDAAINSLEKAVEISSDVGTNLTYLTVAYELGGRHTDAVETVGRLRKVLPMFTSKRFYDMANSNNPTYLSQRRKFADALTRAGLPSE
jgi:tetratricopeptide (TPR) repeat protein